MTNLHTPERLPGESFDKYRERRAASRRAASRRARGIVVGQIVARDRPLRSNRDQRTAVKAAGGIRQYKRQQYRARGWL